MQPNTRAVFAESLGNPSLAVLDIAAVADVAHAHGVPLVIDNTVPSPFLCNPIALGADIVVHSATKYLAGHGTTLGGVIVESGRFPWDNGKFPGMTEPSAGYHGVKFYETFGDFGFSMRARMETLRVYGVDAEPDERLADPAGRGDACRCAWSGIAAMRWPWRSTCAAIPAWAGSTTPGWTTIRSMRWCSGRCASIGGRPGASGLLSFGVRGGIAAGVKFIESAQFNEPPGQHRRHPHT